MKNKIVKLILVAMLVSSCGSERHCQKSVNYARKHGCLVEKSDTIWKRDTIKGWNYDTTVQFLWVHDTDTLFTSNGKDSIITIVKWKERTIRQIKTEKDTVIKTAQITNVKVFEKDLKWYQRYWWAWIYVGVITTLFILGLFVKLLQFKPTNNTF